MCFRALRAEEIARCFDESRRKQCCEDAVLVSGGFRCLLEPVFFYFVPFFFAVLHLRYKQLLELRTVVALLAMARSIALT